MLTFSEKLAWSITQPNRLFDQVRKEPSIKNALLFLLAILVIYVIFSGVIGLLARSIVMDPEARKIYGLGGAAIPLLIGTLSLVGAPVEIPLKFVWALAVAAVVMLLVRILNLPISYKNALKAVCYATPGYYGLRMLALVFMVGAPSATSFHDLIWFCSLLWYASLLTGGLSTLTQTQWPKTIVPGVIGAILFAGLIF